MTPHPALWSRAPGTGLTTRHSPLPVFPIGGECVCRIVKVGVGMPRTPEGQDHQSAPHVRVNNEQVGLRDVIARLVQ